MTPTVDQPLPEHIGRYRLLGRLGAGGMGTVYRAHDPHLDRIVALKVPRLDGPAEQRAARVQRFQREARAAARILHPNVCPIFDVGEHDGAAFVVMAYVEGLSLDQVLAQRGPFADVRAAIALVRQVLDALAAVHAHGIVHRDVKPGNILLDAAGRPILTDFGLARPEESADRLTSEGVVIGTPAYMAPEQAAGQPEQVGPWTDLYAVGVLLYQLLTGRLPFEGPAAAVLGAVVRDEPPSPRHFRPDLDPALEAVLLRALRKDPRARFGDARDFSAALGGLAAPAPIDTAPTIALPARQETKEPRRATGRGWVMRRLRWLGGAVFVAGGGLMAALFLLNAVTADSGGPLVGAVAGTLLVAVPLMLLGLLCWFWVEVSFVPEGLRYAAEKGLAGWVRSAAANGVPLDLSDDMGETALMHAAAGGHTDVVKVLLLYGADTRRVSPLGQTAIEIASARGHGDVVALLQKDTRPQRVPDTVPGPRPSARRWLMGSALLGAAPVVWYYWGAPTWPTQVSADEVRQLVQTKQVRTIEADRRSVQGEVKSPAEHPHLRRGRFWAEFPSGEKGLHSRALRELHQLDPNVSFTWRIGSTTDRPPPAWSVVLLLGVPVGVAALVGWPLGAASWFPVLRPTRRERNGASGP
jgi:hypothetical protein